MKERLYKFIPSSDRHMLSLNFLLAQKITYNKSTLDLKTDQKKIKCSRAYNCEYFSSIFTKHISRYLSSIENIRVKPL